MTQLRKSLPLRNEATAPLIACEIGGYMTDVALNSMIFPAAVPSRPEFKGDR